MPAKFNSAVLGHGRSEKNPKKNRRLDPSIDSEAKADCRDLGAEGGSPLDGGSTTRTRFSVCGAFWSKASMPGTWE